MRTRATRRVAVRYQWDRVKEGFWFAPAIMSLLAILLAWAMYALDVRIPNEQLQSSRFIISGSVDGLRSMLVSLATTTLATAGVVFTLLTLPLSTVAAQYGSRLLRVFLGDRTTQIVLGMFVGTFVYCIEAALSIPPVEVQPEPPQLTATVGLILAVAAFASLIALVQHISIMLQAPNIAAGAGAKFMEVVQAEIPEKVMRGDGGKGGIGSRLVTGEGLGNLVETEGYPVRVRDTGCIQYIDPEIILTLAREKNLVIRLLRKPGRFVRRDEVVALVWYANPRQGQAEPRSSNKQVEEQILMAFRIGNTRTPTQDTEYAVNQLVEMAVRAMSPAINDPFTAMTCLDYLAEGLALFIRQGEKGSHYYDNNGHLRLILEPVRFKDLLNSAFDMLRHASRDNASVLLHMLDAIDVISLEAKPPEARQALARHVGLILAESQSSRLIEDDRHVIQHSSEALLLKLSGEGDSVNRRGEND